MDVFTNLIVVIISQYIHLSRHVRLLPYTMFYVSYISVKLQGENTSGIF